jgi:hypothetical protein
MAQHRHLLDSHWEIKSSLQSFVQQFQTVYAGPKIQESQPNGKRVSGYVGLNEEMKYRRDNTNGSISLGDFFNRSANSDEKAYK